MSAVQTISAKIKKTSFVFVALLPVTIMSYLIASTLPGHSNGVDIFRRTEAKKKTNCSINFVSVHHQAMQPIYFSQCLAE